VGARLHKYEVRTTWTGNTGEGTADYRAYKRDHEISGEGKLTAIPGSSDPVFRGDSRRYNPEELLVGALSACHMLWMLHLCADAGITINAYSDMASGVMAEEPDGSGRFTEVTLRPAITITDATRVQDVEALNARAHELCAMANSVNFPVRCSLAVVAK
jgi:organic hydroperoxide reductase OsmC/OhrA